MITSEYSRLWPSSECYYFAEKVHSTMPRRGDFTHLEHRCVYGDDTLSGWKYSLLEFLDTEKELDDKHLLNNVIW